MPLLKEETYTIDDIYALPEGERAELIDGHMYMMAPPSRKHQKISMELSSIIREYIRSHKGKCEVYAAPFAVYLIMLLMTLYKTDIFRFIFFQFLRIPHQPDNFIFFIVTVFYQVIVKNSSFTTEILFCFKQNSIFYYFRRKFFQLFNFVYII